jgi:hypothetical protein
MHRPIRFAVITILAALALPLTLDAQMMLRPTPFPVVTAENERWYLAGEPITSDGNIYYPTGAQVYFNPYEMVRSGYYRGIPLYSKTTVEPYSVVFVPIAGGLLQPYERRRDGDVAGTVGSTAPSFPVTRDVEGTTGLYQAQGPPTSLSGARLPAVADEYAPVYENIPPRVVVAPEWGALRTAKKPEGLNAFFVEYQGRRWFSSGPVVAFDEKSFSRAGDYHGFAVYSARGQSADTIYVAVTDDPRGMLTPYAAR